MLNIFVNKNIVSINFYILHKKINDHLTQKFNYFSHLDPILFQPSCPHLSVYLTSIY